MQTDIWLNEHIDYSQRCPLCSQPIKKGSLTCFSCGYSMKFPAGMSVWIDPAANGFSLSSSQRQSQQSHLVSQETSRRYARELPQAQRHPNPITPIPPRASVQLSNSSTGSIANLLPQEVDSISWTAGQASESPHARLISSRDRRKRQYIGVSLNPIDRLRWWLLRPGHIEFILWLGGTVLLVAITCVLLFVTAFSFEWITPGSGSPASTNTFGNSTTSGQQSTVVAASKMVLIRMDKGPILLGQPIWLHGEGFSSFGHIRFMFDGTLQLLDQNGQSTSTHANAEGVFTTSLVLDNNLPWNPGPHVISAQDLITKHVAKLQIIFSPAPIGKSLSNTPVPSYPPDATPPDVTPITSVTSGQPAPVGQTPVPNTPTPHPVTPTPTSTVGTTPIVTPTLGTSPIVGTTPHVTTANVSSGLGIALDNAGGTHLDKQLVHLNPLVWLMIACYCLSMILLGLAGVLHKRH